MKGITYQNHQPLQPLPAPPGRDRARLCRNYAAPERPAPGRRARHRAARGATAALRGPVSNAPAAGQRTTAATPAGMAAPRPRHAPPRADPVALPGLAHRHRLGAVHARRPGIFEYAQRRGYDGRAARCRPALPSPLSKGRLQRRRSHGLSLRQAACPLARRAGPFPGAFPATAISGYAATRRVAERAARPPEPAAFPSAGSPAIRAILPGDAQRRQPHRRGGTAHSSPLRDYPSGQRAPAPPASRNPAGRVFHRASNRQRIPARAALNPQNFVDMRITRMSASLPRRRPDQPLPKHGPTCHAPARRSSRAGACARVSLRNRHFSSRARISSIRLSISSSSSGLPSRRRMWPLPSRARRIRMPLVVRMVMSSIQP